MKLTTVFFAHHKTHNISKLQFHLNDYKYGTYPMLMLDCFGRFGMLSTRDFTFKELASTNYNPELPKDILNDTNIGLWMFIFENIHNYIIPNKGNPNFQARNHKVIYTFLFVRTRLFLHEYIF